MGDRLRVLVVFAGIAGGQTSGAQRMAWRTTAALARRGHEVAVLTDARPPADLDLTGWPAVTAEDPLSSFPPDVVHGYDLALPGAVARARELAERAGARFALTPASTVDIWPDRAMGGRLCAAADVLYVLTRTEADAVCALGAEPARLRELPAAPDLVGSPRPAAFRTRYGVSGPLVLFLGRRVATKGYRTLLDAAPAVWAAFPDTVFAFAGPLGEPAAAKAFAALTDRRILDLGVVDEQTKHDALAACDVFCLPTSADVFPLVFAEAWSAGRPVVTGRFTGVDDVVRDGVDALVTDPDPAALARCLCVLLADPDRRATLGRAGRLRVPPEMGWDRVAAAVEAGYRLIIGTVKPSNSQVSSDRKG